MSYPTTPPSTRDRVAALIKAGDTVLDVAHTLRISPQAVYKHLKALGITPPSKKAGEKAS